jgi:hypothetical protein
MLSWPNYYTEVFTMDGFVCSSCYTWLVPQHTDCPSCGIPVILEGDDKNVIDHLQPNCLIHRYDGSDMLEPAVIVKAGKTNMKVATKLREYAKPVTVSKQKVYQFDPNVLSAIQALRNERTATINRYDIMIQTHWKKLETYQ